MPIATLRPTMSGFYENRTGTAERIEYSLLLVSTKACTRRDAVIGCIRAGYV